MNNNKFILVSFLVIVFGVFLLYPINILFNKNIVRTDNWKVYEPKKENGLIDVLDNKIGSIKTSLENRVTNGFPGYYLINKTYEKINYSLNSIFFKKDIPIKKNSDGEYVFYNSKDDFYYLRSSYSKKELDERLEKQIKFFNNLSKEIDDLNIYYSTRYEFTNLDSNNLSSYVDKFDKSISADIKIKHQDITSVNDYKKRFYLTDHHWNMYGALEGYKDIMDMLGADAINDVDIKKVIDVKYYGSLAKSSVNDNISDTILDVDINLNYDVIVNGQTPDELFKPRKISKRTNKFHDYYVQYFNGQYGEVIYDYKNHSKENLLIMCDSYAWQIDYLIASGFNKTHVINLRYDEFANNDFDIKKYMTDNNITKVLFLYEGESIIFDEYNYNLAGRVS